MHDKDQKNLQNIYINLYENFEQNDNNIINDIVSFFGEENGIPEYIGKTFIATIQNNGIENINDTYEYVDSFIKKLGMLKAGSDVVRDNTLNACIKTKEYIQRLQNS